MQLRERELLRFGCCDAKRAFPLMNDIESEIERVERGESLWVRAG